MCALRNTTENWLRSPVHDGEHALFSLSRERLSRHFVKSQQYQPDYFRWRYEDFDVPRKIDRKSIVNSNDSHCWYVGSRCQKRAASVSWIMLWFIYGIPSNSIIFSWGMSLIYRQFYYLRAIPRILLHFAISL